MGSKEELLRVVEEQKSQIATYETKLKTYKSLETEKKALEGALTAIAPEYDKQGDDVPKEELASTSTGGDLAKEQAPDQLESLKQALLTLTVENKRKEQAFQSDKRALIQKSERLENEVEKLRTNAGSQTLRNLKKQLGDIEAERERMLNEHGQIAAEMQQRYAKEKMHAGKMEKQVTELSRRLQEKDEFIQGMEARLKEVGRLESEVQMLKKKAEVTPTAQVLQEELANTKAVYEEEVLSIRNRHAINSSVLSDKDSRIVSLENRVKQLTEQSASSERNNMELQNSLEDLKRQLAFVSTQHEKLKSSLFSNASIELEKNDAGGLAEEVERMCRKMRELEPDFDFYALLGLDKPTVPDASQISLAKLSVDQQQIDRSRQPSPDYNSCDSCEASQKEANHFKVLIGHLQKKLEALEEGHESSKHDHEQMSETLRKRILELEESQERIYSQLTVECKSKVAELEHELQKQQLRMMDLAAEKDQEIETTKNSLAALYAKGYSNAPLDPLDPPQTISSSNRSERRRKELAQIGGSMEELGAGLLAAGSPMDDVTDTVATTVRRTSTNQFGEARNIFYEQELIKREQEIFELRNMVRLSELKVRDTEQSMLTKQIVELQIVEMLKEEIRVLEGRLTLERSETNMAYLRNIFIQFINSNNALGRKHILKAIGAVLRLTHIEMKKIECWTL